MPSLHHTTASSSAWTAELVQQRLVDAFIVDRKLPGHRQRMAGAWLLETTHTFADVVGWDNPGDGASDRTLQNWGRLGNAQPIEVSMWEEALGWLSMLPKDEKQCLGWWAKCKAWRYQQTKVYKKIGYSKSSFDRKRKDGSLRIACALNRVGVQVR